MNFNLRCCECHETKEEIERKGSEFLSSIGMCSRCLAVQSLKALKEKFPLDVKLPSLAPDVNLSATGLPPPMTPPILKDIERFTESPDWWVRLLPKSDLDIWGLKK